VADEESLGTDENGDEVGAGERPGHELATGTGAGSWSRSRGASGVGRGAVIADTVGHARA
jgi:hypothetical protein